LSETDRTRGASSEDLLNELLEPVDVGDAKPWRCCQKIVLPRWL
jgi:hypothetical protein